MLQLVTFSKFAIVGVLATVVHYGLLHIGIWKAGLSPWLSNGLAAIGASSVSYLGQALWVFGRSVAKASQYSLFILSLAIGFCLNSFIMYISTEVLRLSYTIGFGIGVLVVPVFAFVFNRAVVFRQY